MAILGEVFAAKVGVTASVLEEPEVFVFLVVIGSGGEQAWYQARPHPVVFGGEGVGQDKVSH